MFFSFKYRESKTENKKLFPTLTYFCALKYNIEKCENLSTIPKGKYYTLDARPSELLDGWIDAWMDDRDISWNFFLNKNGVLIDIDILSCYLFVCFLPNSISWTSFQTSIHRFISFVMASWYSMVWMFQGLFNSFSIYGDFFFNISSVKNNASGNIFVEISVHLLVFPTDY